MNDLEIFRTELDEIDKNLINYLSMRFKLVEKIWKYKKKHNITPLQPDRWQQVLNSRKAYWKEKKIEKDFIEKIWNEIHKYSLDIEEK